VQEQTLLIKNIPKTIFSQTLEKSFESFGQIISCKVSINDDYSSRGYGFVYFNDRESAARALKDT
jgi:polyadenylate-binding protein